MRSPLLSVVLPVYNSESFIGQAMYSVLRQNFTDFELIVVNDGSTDRTLEIIRSICKVDKRIKLISRNNYGLVHSLNEAIDFSSGDWIARMVADYFSFPELFSFQL